ncbi:hypothetical protein WJX73_004758 [Symbiochloris irregularis]|uniref:Lipin N-terminal domain-containing protein n=1 Tax=Symbiochloris irregularis TaxID=706552 RepID=A0AAW1NPA0_9CHLO
MSRAANAFKTNAMAVGSSIMYVAPHMAGAIDVVVVRQPDGTLKSSPFYVRFGKYTGMRTAEKRVKIFVNGEEATFHMHLGTTGEAFFVVEQDPCTGG